jgi:hypothetical protein
MSFLDKDGLAYLWNKIGEKLAAIPKTMTVNVTSGNDGYTADKTFAEILAAINGGQMVRAVLDGTIYFNDVTLSGDTPVSVIIFSSVENFGQLISLFVDNNDAWTFNYSSVPKMLVASGSIVKRDSNFDQFIDALPGTDYMAPVPVTAEDNGKVLAVTNGAWSAQQLAIETWTFTLEDGSEVTKTIVTGVSQIL